VVGRFKATGRFGGGNVNGNQNPAAAAFLGFGLVPFVGEKMFQRRQQKRTEPSFGGIRAGELFFLQQPREKFLGQILRVVWTVPLPSHKGVNWKPVAAAKFFQGVARVRGVVAPGGYHERPMGGDKRRARWRFGAGWS
jgi:hypothetical protein